MSKRFDDAVRYAVEAHSGQTRKLHNIPYALHPMEVAAIIATMTEDEDVMIAGLLHDTVEDCGKDPAELERLFGRRVAALVAAETEKRNENVSLVESWKQRKAESLEELRQVKDIGAKILWLADKLANMRSLHHRWMIVGDEAFNAFHMKDKAQQRWYYQTVADYTSELTDTAAHMEYVERIRRVFDGEGTK